MESKDASFDMHVMSGQSGGAYVLHTQRHVAGLSRALCFADPWPNKDQAKTGGITGRITGKRTGEKALFRNVKRLNRMEIFLGGKNCKKAMRSSWHKGPHICRSDTGTFAGRKSPDPEAQVVESAADFGVKNFSPIFAGGNLRIGARRGRSKRVGANLSERESPVPFRAQRDDPAHLGPQGQGIEFVQREPPRLRRVGGSLGGAGNNPGAVINQHEMIVGRAIRHR